MCVCLGGVRLTDCSDDSPSKEESRAQIPQAAVVDQCSCRVYTRANGRHDLLEGERETYLGFCYCWGKSSLNSSVSQFVLTTSITFRVFPGFAVYLSVSLSFVCLVLYLFMCIPR